MGRVLDIDDECLLESVVRLFAFFFLFMGIGAIKARQAFEKFSRSENAIHNDGR